MSKFVVGVELCHHGIAAPQGADGENELQVRKTIANTLNKQRIADRGWSSSFGV
jgi:hypothetical protein